MTVFETSFLRKLFLVLALASPLALAGCLDEQASAPADGQNQETGAAPEQPPATDG